MKERPAIRHGEAETIVMFVLMSDWCRLLSSRIVNMCVSFVLHLEHLRDDGGCNEMFSLHSRLLPMNVFVSD